MNATYRIELYEVIGEGGRYFHITVQASTVARAWAKARDTYPAHIYRAARISLA